MSNQEETYVQPEIIESDFSPLDAPVKKRSYTNHNIDESQLFEALDEPTFEAPNFDSFEPVEEVEKEEPRMFNPEFTELDNKEKAMGAEMMAEMVLDIYEKGCGFLGKIPEISESKIDNLIAEGEIEYDCTLPTENGDMPIKQFAQEFNGSIKEAFEVSEEFKEKVKPPLIRVFKKRGVGMTDEQLLAYYFATDLGTKGVQAFMLKKTTNNILDSLRQNTQALRESRNQNMAYSQPQAQPQAQPQQEVKREEAPAPKVEKEEASEYVEVSEIITESQAPKKERRPRPKTNLEKQLEHFEPEEQSVYSNLRDGNGFAYEGKDISGMPVFGDSKILSEIEKLSQEPKRPKKVVGKGLRTVRKPRG
jgi:hypothetical protein